MGGLWGLAGDSEAQEPATPTDVIATDPHSRFPLKRIPGRERSA